MIQHLICICYVHNPSVLCSACFFVCFFTQNLTSGNIKNQTENDLLMSRNKFYIFDVFAVKLIKRNWTFPSYLLPPPFSFFFLFFRQCARRRRPRDMGSGSTRFPFLHPPFFSLTPTFRLCWCTDCTDCTVPFFVLLELKQDKSEIVSVSILRNQPPFFSLSLVPFSSSGRLTYNSGCISF